MLAVPPLKRAKSLTFGTLLRRFGSSPSPDPFSDSSNGSREMHAALRDVVVSRSSSKKCRRYICNPFTTLRSDCHARSRCNRANPGSPLAFLRRRPSTLDARESRAPAPTTRDWTLTARTTSWPLTATKTTAWRGRGAIRLLRRAPPSRVLLQLLPPLPTLAQPIPAGPRATKTAPTRARARAGPRALLPPLLLPRPSRTST